MKKYGSKVVEECEMTLGSQIDKLRNNELKLFSRDIKKLDPFSSIGKVIEDLEACTGIKCIPIEKEAERAILQITFNATQNRKNIEGKLLKELNRYPFVQGKIEKEIIELKKIR